MPPPHDTPTKPVTEPRSAFTEPAAPHQGTTGSTLPQMTGVDTRGIGFPPAPTVSRHARGATGKRSGSTDNQGGGKFDPSRCGGHKNLENVATFSKFLGRRTNFSPAPDPTGSNLQQVTELRANGRETALRWLAAPPISPGRGVRFQHPGRGREK